MSLASDLKRASQRIKMDTEKKLRGTCFSLSSKVIKRTPVGNPDLWESPPPHDYIGGTLRNAWRASVNAPSSEVGTTPDEGAGMALGTVNEAVARLGLGNTFYVANNMPYARRVEEGWSSQAPAGMVGITLAEAKAEAERGFRG